MPTAAIYARYSSDLQRDASIEDQVRVCRRRMEQEGWTPGPVYSDHAVSGASHLRPGFQAMLEGARSGAFDVLLAESLDRLSRDQEHVAGLFKTLSYHGVQLITLSEGAITELNVGLKGAMSALYLKDLADKTRRGLEGRVRGGKSAGGISYGYRTVRAIGPDGAPLTGNREIEPAEAETVRRIFRDYAAGRSPRAIAAALNREGAQGPLGRPWGASTIYGNWRRGTGILNNELYVGKLIWNRQRFVKDPETGRRQARPNPPEDWITEDVPQHRIVAADLWDAVKARQAATRQAIEDDGGLRRERARRPKHLLAGLLKCGACGGGYTQVGATRYGCANRKNKGTCGNALTIRRDVLEETVLGGPRDRLMHPDLVADFMEEYRREAERLRKAEGRADTTARKALAKTERQIARLLDAIKAGGFVASMADELRTLEARKAQLAATITEPAPEPPVLHPGLVEVYRRKVGALRETLDDPELRTEAVEALRSVLDEIRLVPAEDELRIELVGALAGILALCDDEGPRRGTLGGLQSTVVAGAGFEPATFRL